MIAVDRHLPDPEDPADAPPHSLVVFLADQRSRGDAKLLAQVARARARSLPVLPLARSAADVPSALPKALQPLHAAVWADPGTVRAVLRLLGLVERRRRLFLSYRRQETTELALQLREHLSRRSFDVFLDRFSVPPAADFQRRIDIELSDKAFVLLLESPSAAGSPWVQHEVTYALTHGIALMALTLPDVTDRERFSTVDEAFRYRLIARDLSAAGSRAPGETGEGGPQLTAAALAAVLDEIENRYARQLRQRREQLLGSLADWLDLAGHRPTSTDNEWALVTAPPRRRAVAYLVSPRAPAPSDVRDLDRLRGLTAREGGRLPDGCLVHAARTLDPDEEDLIKWIIDKRPLTTRPHHAVPDLLGLS